MSERSTRRNRWFSWRRDMLLAVDVGNTNTTLGAFDGDRLIADWRVATRKDATADEIGVLFRSMFTERRVDSTAVRGMIVSSVVPDLNGVIARVGEVYFRTRPLFVEPGVRTGLPILYENP